MKKANTILAVLALALSVPVMAGQGQKQGLNSTVTAGASNQGVSTSLTQNSAPIPADTSVDIKNVPDVSAPGLTTTMTETCMGSTSGGVAWLGFGITGGTTWRDGRCANRLDARQLGNFGVQVNDARLVFAGVELLCENSSVQAAAARAGVICGPQGDDAPVSDERPITPIAAGDLTSDAALPAFFVDNER